MKYSFNSTGTLAVLATSPTYINGVLYQQDEPVAFFTDVYCDIDFLQLQSAPVRGVSNLLASSSSAPNKISFSGVSQQDGVLNLLFVKSYDIISRVIENKVATSVNKRITLNSQYPIDENSIIVYIAGTKTKVEYSISGTDIVVPLDGTYLVFFTTLRESIASFETSGSTNGYLKLQYATKGNIDGETGMMVIDIPKSCITSVPSLGTLNGNDYSDTLTFTIVQTSKEETMATISFIK